MRKPVIAGNWKMNKTVSEAVTLASELNNTIGNITDVQAVICPVFTAIKSVADTVKGTNIIAKTIAYNCSNVVLSNIDIFKLFIALFLYL